jgi:hypothetical protein
MGDNARSHQQEARTESAPHEDEDRRPPDERAVPKHNPPVDDYDVERGKAKLERVIGK